ncbi:hypothetical protein IAD21_04134 [Abditibacteriota bacterium]|nr:hypothetical protein IAD21_04134 [Abditibacteriota bacterium]
MKRLLEVWSDKFDDSLTQSKYCQNVDQNTLG